MERSGGCGGARRLLRGWRGKPFGRDEQKRGRKRLEVERAQGVRPWVRRGRVNVREARVVGVG